ncbi:MAG: UbiA family prenyltransferase [Deltaproteobacteria bacterium]|nr:UbiA family prenyltransferase [Deltaproteobacteria bacterium]
MRFSHTIFALPFVFATIAIASLHIHVGLRHIVLIILAMATARSAAMGLNRIIDRGIDAKNVRTKNRELVTGEISLKSALLFVSINVVLFLVIAASFNRVTLVCAPVLLIFFVIYPYFKRFSWLSHFFLGFVIGLSPIATWIALTGTVSLPAALLGAAMMCWIAGFDIVYALLDVEFDKKAALYSLPALFGIKISLVVSALLHVFTLIFLMLAFRGPIYLVGMIIMAAVLVYEHWIIRPDDFSRVNTAFFSVNGIASILYCCFTWLEIATTT